MPKKSINGKSKKKKKISRPSTGSGLQMNEKGLPIEMRPSESSNENPVKRKPSRSGKLPQPTTICMRTALPTEPTSVSMQAFVTRAMCPTLAILSRPEAFCPANTGTTPCPIIRSQTCASQNGCPSGFNAAQQQGYPPQPQELQSQAPIIVCTPSQLSLATRIATDGQLPTPDMVSPRPMTSRVHICPQPMPTEPSLEMQYPQAPPSGYIGMEGGILHQCPDGQMQWARPVQGMADLVPYPEEVGNEQDYPYLGTGLGPYFSEDDHPDFEAPSSCERCCSAGGSVPCFGSEPGYAATTVPWHTGLGQGFSQAEQQELRTAPPTLMRPASGATALSPGSAPTTVPWPEQQDFQSPQPSQIRPTEGGTARFPESAPESASATVPVCCVPSDASGTTLTIPLSSTAQETSHVVTIDIRVRSVQKPTLGVSISKSQNDEPQMNAQLGTMQNKTPYNPPRRESPQESPPVATMVPETPLHSAEKKYSSDTVHQMTEDGNQQMQRNPPPSSSKTRQPVIPERTGQRCSKRQVPRQFFPCSSRSGILPQQFSPGQRYSCMIPRVCNNSMMRGQVNLSTSQVQRPTRTHSNFDNRMDRVCRMRPRSGSYPSFQSPCQPAPRRTPSGSSFLFELTEVIPSISSISRPTRENETARVTENNQTAMNSTRGKRNVSENRSGMSHSESIGSRTQVSPDTQTIQNPPVNSTSDSRRKRRSDPSFQSPYQPASRRTPSGSSFLSELTEVIPSFSAISRPTRENATARATENNQTAMNSTRGKRNVSGNRSGMSRSESIGSRTQVPPDTQTIQNPPVNSTSDSRRKRRYPS